LHQVGGIGTGEWFLRAFLYAQETLRTQTGTAPVASLRAAWRRSRHPGPAQGEVQRLIDQMSVPLIDQMSIPWISCGLLRRNPGTNCESRG